MIDAAAAVTKQRSVFLIGRETAFRVGKRNFPHRGANDSRGDEKDVYKRRVVVCSLTRRIEISTV